MPHGLPLTLLIEWTFSPAYRTIAPYSARNQTCISVDTHFNSRNTSVAGLTTTIFQNSRDRRYKEAIQMLIGQFSEINCSTQRKTLPFLFHIPMPNTLLRIFVQLFFSGTLSVVRYKKYSKDMIIGCKSIYQRFKTRDKCNMIIFKRKVFSVHSNFVPFLNRNSAANDLLKFFITPLSVHNSRSRLERFTLNGKNRLPEKCVTNTIWLKRTVCCGCICLR